MRRALALLLAWTLLVSQSFALTQAQIASFQNNRITVPNGLVGYWRMDAADVAGSTLFDRSGNGNNMTLGATTQAPSFVAGKIAQAAKFASASSQYMSRSLNASLEPTSLSACLWASVNTASTAYVIFASAPSSNVAPYVAYGINTNASNQFFAWTQVSSTYNAARQLTQSGTFSTNTWYHVCLVYNSTIGQQLYINGVLNNSDSNTGSPYYGNMTKLYVAVGANGVYSNITVDDACLYDRSISAAEVMEKYTAGLAGHQ